MVLPQDCDCLSEASVNPTETYDCPSKAYDRPLEACDFSLLRILVTISRGREEGLKLLQPSPRRSLHFRRIRILHIEEPTVMCLQRISFQIIFS